MIIAGNGFHQAHDRVFVREELQKFLTPSIGIIVEEVVVFEPSLMLKMGLIIIDTPGTMDTNPFRRAATRDAVQQADMLVALSSDASLQIGSWIEVLREADFWKRMLRHPTTCKIMLLSTLDEKGRRLTAAKVHEQWNDTCKPLCKARQKGVCLQPFLAYVMLSFCSIQCSGNCQLRCKKSCDLNAVAGHHAQAYYP